MAKHTPLNVTSGFASQTQLNTEFQSIADELNNKVLYRNNPAGEPNLMNNDLDMNSNHILNLPAPVNANEAARLADVQAAISGANNANLLSYLLNGETVEVGSLQGINGVTALRTHTATSGYSIYLRYHTTAGDGGHGVFRAVTGAAPGTYVDNGGTIIVPTGGDGSAAWLRVYKGAVEARWFGGTWDGVADDTSAMNAALASVGNSGSIKLSGSPRFTSAITFPTTSTGIRVYADNHIIVLCDHTGDGFVLNGANENYGGNVLENLEITGPNTKYPAGGYTPTSTGAGIRMQTAYDNTFINVKVYGFLYGEYLKTGFNNKHVGDCELKFNQHGVYIDGGATNLNHFDGVKIRENRLRGVTIIGGAGPYPTQNSFVGAYIETNIPYAGGYPVGGPGDGSNSVGVYLDRTYDNDFTNVYFENQEYDIWLTNQSSGNRFTGSRHAPSADFSRLGKIKFSGASAYNNTFINCTNIARNTTDVHVESDNADQLGNMFVDCTGFNFISGSILAPLYIRNNRPYAGIYGNPDGTISFPSFGYKSNPIEGTTRGTITGIGTSTATLNANGYSEVQLGSTITSPTTITTFSGLKKHQLFTLWNYQVAQPVTIASGSSTGNIILKGTRNAIFTAYGQSITFWVNGLGRAYEIGRNFTVPQVGTATIADTATSVTVTLPIAEPDYNYKVFVTQVGAGTGTPALGSRRLWVSGRTLTTITISCEVAPGAGNSVPIDWQVVRNY